MMKYIFNWLDTRFPLRATWQKYASNYYVPKNLNFYYCFGVLALFIILNQWVSGLWLTMFFTPTISGAFSSVEYIMREVPWGWLLRYCHSTGASMLFIVLYVHIFRGLLYGSYQKPRELVWLLGCGLFFLMMMEAFMGYLLPWGQMSYWGSEVITSLFGAIPYIGDHLSVWLRGGYSVGEPTLHRFFALHVAGIPIFIFLIIYLHIVALHKVGSNNPEGIEINKLLDVNGIPLDGEPFYPKYVLKDLFALIIFLTIFLWVIFFLPDFNGYFLEPANFSEANRFVTPEHMTPMWYMTPFYAMLRAISNRLGGIFILFSSLFLLCLLPWLDRSFVRSMRYKGKLSRYMLSVWVINFMLLCYLGLQPVTKITQLMSQLGTIIYFTYFLLMPVYTRIEKHSELPSRIN